MLDNAAARHALRLKGVTKVFGGITALDKVFPDARYCMTHRDVAAVIPSVSDLYYEMHKAATDTLLGALKTKQGPRAVPLRHHAAIGLGFTGDPKVVEPLIQALDEERDFLVASYISRSLGWITKTQDVQPQASSWRTWWQNNKKRFGEGSSPDAGEIQLKLGPDGLPVLDDKPADKPR